MLKGQLISELNFGVFKSPKKANQIFDRLHRAENCLKFGWLLMRLEDTPKFHSDIIVTLADSKLDQTCKIV